MPADAVGVCWVPAAAVSCKPNAVVPAIAGRWRTETSADATSTAPSAEDVRAGKEVGVALASAGSGTTGADARAPDLGPGRQASALVALVEALDALVEATPSAIFRRRLPLWERRRGSRTPLVAGFEVSRAEGSCAAEPEPEARRPRPPLGRRTVPSTTACSAAVVVSGVDASATAARSADGEPRCLSAKRKRNMPVSRERSPRLVAVRSRPN